MVVRTELACRAGAVNREEVPMSPSSFHVAWIVAFAVLAVLALWIGRLTKHGWLGILVDGRGRYSLAHFQVVLWTVVILSSLIAAFISQGFDPAALQLSPELLGLMGISLGSSVLSAGVKAAKDTKGSGAHVAHVGVSFHRTDGPPETITAHFDQIWLAEEGNQADKVVDITKYQNFIFTLVILMYYVATAWKLAAVAPIPENIVWLIGISHAGYVGGKIPNTK
jgi:hypothetical protein